MDKSGIYGIFNVANNKCYVGQTYSGSGFNERFRRHKCELRHNRHSNPHLQDAWNKYGEEWFEFRILEECNDDMLNIRETAWIEYYNALDRNFGYNLQEVITNRTYYRGRMSPHSEETRRKISRSLKGRKISEETLRKRMEASAIRKANGIKKNNGRTGIKHSEETRRKMSIAKKGMRSNMFGKHHSEEIKRKMSNTKRKKRQLRERAIEEAREERELLGI